MEKQKVINYLMIACFALLLVNFALEVFVKKNPSSVEAEKPQLTANEVKERFEATIGEFGLKNEAFKVKKTKTNLPDSLSGLMQVRLPKDLPATVVLNELNKTFMKYDLSIRSKELTKGKDTDLKILSGKTLLLRARLQLDTSVVRRSGELGFMINDINKLSESKIEQLLNLPEKFAVILNPSEKDEKLKSMILSSAKEFAVLLDDNIDEVRFKLKEEYTDKRLQRSILAMLNSFNESKLFMIDDASDLMKSKVFGFVQGDFTKRGFPLIPLNTFVTVKGNDNQDLQSMFKYYCESSGSSGKKVFLVSADDYMQLRGSLELLRKRGYRFIPPSVLGFGLKQN